MYVCDRLILTTLFLALSHTHHSIVADESDAVTGDKEIAASQAEAVEDGQNGTGAGIAEAAAANGSLSRSAVTDDKTSEVKEHVNEVQEAEAKGK